MENSANRAEFPTVSTASTAGQSDEEKRKTIALTVQSESSRQEAGESVKTTSPGHSSMAGFEVIMHGRFSGAHRGERLRRIDAAGGETETGVVIVTLQGYISGIPSLFSTDFNTAFVFKNPDQAKAFITEFADELHNPQILDCP